MKINEIERTIITEALSDLLLYIQKSVPHLRNTSAENLTANTMAISTAKIKLSRIVEDPEQKFTLMELKVMYWALRELSANTRDFLDSVSLSDPDRNTAFETEKTCNHLLRFFRDQFEKAGVSPPDELLPH